MHSIDKILNLKTIFFLYIIFYSIATLLAPEASSAKYIAAITGSYTFPLNFIKFVLVVSLLGLFRTRTPVRMWVFLLPAIAYAFVSLTALSQAPNPSLTGGVNFLFWMLLAVTMTWEKING